MRRALGQTIIIENTTGAAGSIAVGRVARAAPDGYTLSIGHWSTHVVNGAIYPLSYDLLKDLDPVALLPSNPQLIVSRKDVPAKDLKELVAWVKANQDKITAGTAGAGSASHVGGVYFQQFTNTKFTFVPYRGAGPAMLDLVAGTIDIMCDQSSNSLPQVRSNSIKAYAVTAPKRLASAPDIPTVDEAGLPGFYISVWHGLWVPHGTPQGGGGEAHRRRAGGACRSRRCKSAWANSDRRFRRASSRRRRGLAAFQKAEIEKWWPIIKAAGIKAE